MYLNAYRLLSRDSKITNGSAWIQKYKEKYNLMQLRDPKYSV